MEKITKIERDIAQRAKALMSGKPIWLYWVVYTIAVAVCFGVTYLLLFLLSLNWWIVALIVVIAGMGLGTYSYMHDVKGKESHQD